MARQRVLVIVSDPADLQGLPAGRVITADEYLGGGERAARGVTIVNLCRSYRYRSKGYYVSLIADARGHRALPAVETIEGLSEPFAIFRVLHEAGIPTVDISEMRTRRIAPAAAETKAGEAYPVEGSPEAGQEIGHQSTGGPDAAETLAYFGVSADPRFRAAAQAIHREWPAPVIRIRFVHEDEEWKVAHVSAVPLRQLKRQEHAALVEALQDDRRIARRGSPSPRELKRASIAVLVDEEDPFSPSSPETIDRLIRVASRLNVYVHRIGLDDIDRLGEYDALFIRALTGVREPSFPFALRAEMLDMPVLDDSQSIIRCSNKVFLEELLHRAGIPMPKTRVVAARTPWNQVADLGSPIVVKLPDGSFSAAVHKIQNKKEFESVTSEMFRRSPLIIAQEFLPTDFDWRVTVLDGRVLFVARYFMAKGHWQIRSVGVGGERYGRVEAIPRDSAPPEVLEIALRSATLIGNGLYGVDIKETPRGPVVIEVNDNPNLDIGYDDAADGSIIYEDLINYFLRQIEEGPSERDEAAPAERKKARPRERAPDRRHYRPFAVAGLELEYAVVDRDLNAVSVVEEAFRLLAGRPTSDVELEEVAYSNEIADHVFEVKIPAPVRDLADAERILYDGVQRFSKTLRSDFGARLLPTGMHPWLNPKKAKLWERSNTRIYKTFARLFDVQTHGWMNVHATHLNLPFGREREAVAMYNATALLIPYLPALAASSPMYDGDLQQAVDNRMIWILEHQTRIPESCGEIVPEYIESFADYRKRILQPMYRALDRLPDSSALRHEFLNARGAVLKFSRKSMEIRVLDTQECVKLDVAIAVFVRSALRHLTQQLEADRIALPEHSALVSDLRATVMGGGEAAVIAPFLTNIERAADGSASAQVVLRELLVMARRGVRKAEAGYLDLVERMIETGSLSERIRAALAPYADQDEEFTEAARRIYIELADALEANEPWKGRGL